MTSVARYVEVASGLNYQDESGEWRESEDLIELTVDGGAAAVRGQHKLHFAANVNTIGAITMTTVSNRVFRSQPLGLYYFDAETGKSALIAAVKDSVGELHPPNQVIYKDCLDGMKADYRVTYTKAGIEADLVLLQQIPEPAMFGIISRSARLEWITEFLDMPAPTKRAKILKQEADPARREIMVEPDLVDETLDFGDLLLPLGRAFAFGHETTRVPGSPATIRMADRSIYDVLVAKRWIVIEDRTVLVESVDWSDVAPKLASLPEVAAADSTVREVRASVERHLPAVSVAKGEAKTITVASAAYSPKGFALDYLTQSTSVSSFTFASGTTYFISGSFAITSSATIMPGAVLKYANVYMNIYNLINCQATAAQPAIFTAKDDNRYGETILGSTGNPAGAFFTALWFYNDPYGSTLSNLRFRHANEAIKYDGASGSHTISDTKLEQCVRGLSFNGNNGNVTLVNVTKCNVPTPIYANGNSEYGVVGSMTEDCSLDGGADADSDGLLDSWEMQYFNSLVPNGTGDADGDGYTNLQEYQSGTNPVQASVTIGEPLGPSSRRTGLVISEIMYNPPTTGFAPPNNSEYVEIYNSEPISKNIGGFALVVRDKNDVVILNQPIPANTVILPGGFMVVATPNLPNDSGTIQLTNRWGAVLLEAQYSDEAPWPKQADGAGHSLVLVRPSYGENDPRAWGASDLRGGSPGKGEIYATEPARSVVINEFLASSSGGNDFIELYNHSNASVDVTGYRLSDSSGNLTAYTIPANKGVIPARGFVSFTETELGFALSASGEQIFFSNPGTVPTRVLDAVDFKAQRSGVSMGRYRDGAPMFSELATLTAGAANSGLYNPTIENIVINEIMYNPVSGTDNDEYIELYNRGGSSVTLNGWTISGVGYTFPSTPPISIGTGANGYFVVAKNVANLRSKYANLNTGNSIGDYGGRLDNRGERIALVNAGGVVIDEVTYSDGGRWGQWSDAGGSSLELIDPRSDNRLAANWADSDESAKSGWTTVDVSGLLDNGAGTADWLEVTMVGVGECLIDDVQVLGSTGTPHMLNPSFDSGLANWTLQGNHDKSAWQSSGGINNTGCLLVRATGRGDTGANRIFGRFDSARTPGTSNTIQAKVRWLRGRPEILFRMRGNYLEAFTSMSLPANLGSPGQQNSRFAANVGPAIFDVAHSPVLPAASQAVVVTARAHDPDGISALTLYYRVNSTTPPGSFSSLSMLDNGTAGDAISGDGVYSATIPGQSSGVLISFYVQANDVPGLISKFPNDAPTRECYVRFGETQPAGSFGTYRLWMTKTTADNWAARLKLSNDPLDITFVYGNYRVIYNAGAAYSGSPFTTYQVPYDSPTGKICGYGLQIPSDDRFLGADEMILDWPAWHQAGQQEQIADWIADQIGLPNLYRRYVNLFANGVATSSRGLGSNPPEFTLGAKIYEDLQQPGSDTINEWFPADAIGELLKLDVRSEWNETVTLSAFDDFPLVQNYTTTGGVKKKARYRWTWRKRAAALGDDYTTLYSMIDALLTQGSSYTTQVETTIDLEQWMRVFALEDAVGNWDSFGNGGKKNMYAYRSITPTDNAPKWRLLIWDLDATLGVTVNGWQSPTAPLFFASSNDDLTLNTLNRHPPFERAFWRGIQELANGPMMSGSVNPVIDAKLQALQANGVVATSANTPITQADADTIKNYISQRRSFILGLVPSALFEITSNGGANFSTSQASYALTGTAPVNVRTLKVNTVAAPSTAWTTVTGWTYTVSLNLGANLITVQGYDSAGTLVGTDTITITRN